jgi:hypothetical protein
MTDEIQMVLRGSTSGLVWLTLRTTETLAISGGRTLEEAADRMYVACGMLLEEDVLARNRCDEANPLTPPQVLATLTYPLYGRQLNFVIARDAEKGNSYNN